ncbi:MAG: hypothetical protein IPQ05_14095 [Leptospiraceae bacterium]|nr:hypothetical protein [Leptospiraceae bacterium]MBK9500621.1 hypothetical protein [Leptospiraceae bacterium]MBL0264956.1 hypothetical protein [Leptospiraceae bacterium]
MKTVTAILLAFLWISISEFARNEFILKTHWTKHYESLGLIFPSSPINGAIWGIWSLAFSITIYTISKKFSLLETVFIAWFAGFVLMWLVIGNMGVLPISILYFAIPLSILEVYLATFIIMKLS